MATRLSVSLKNLGNLAVEAGDFPTARGYYEACLQIRKRLADIDPMNAQWQGDLEAISATVEELREDV